MQLSVLRQRLLVATALILIVLSIGVLSAWALGASGAMQELSVIVMQPETALGFLLTAAGLLCTRWQQPALTMAAASLVALLGVTALIQNLAEWNFLGQLVIPGAAGESDERYWGRMAPNTAVAFLLAAASLVLVRRGHDPQRPISWMAGFCGSAICVLAVTSLLTTLLDVGLTPLWPLAGDMALPTSLAFLLLGTCLIALSWDPSTSTRPQIASSLIPAIIGGAVIVLSAVVWVALEKVEHQLLQQIADVGAQSAARTIEARRTDLQGQLSRLAGRMSRGMVTPGPGFASDAQELMIDSPFVALAWADNALTVRQIESAEPALALVSPSLADARHRGEVTDALRQGRAVMSAARPVNGDRFCIYSYLPVYRDGSLLGVLIGVIDLRGIFDEALKLGADRGYGGTIMFNGRYIYGMRPVGPITAGHIAGAGIDMAPPGWRVLTWPLPALARQQHSPFPVVVLVLGASLGVLLTFALRARRLLIDSLGQLGLLNTELEQRVESRTRQLRNEVAERERLAGELAHAASHDALTGLPNRSLFREHLERALAHAKREQRTLAVMFLDLDHFKEINDTLGHQRGDELLVEFARRIRRAVRHSDVVARQGGDEFLVLTEDLAHPDDAAEVADKILQTMEPAVDLGEHHIQIGTSIGIATGTAGVETPDILIKYADTALYQAKSAGRGRYAFYSPALHRLVRQRTALKAELRRAIERDQLIVHYQPRIDLRSNSVVGAEALVRWQRDDGQLVQPDFFIPLAEESSLIVALGEQVICRVIDDLARWHQLGQPPPTISLNVSAKQFHGKDTLVSFSRCLAGARNLAPFVELELTERILITCHKSCHTVIGDLAAQGYRIAIDDFGTGYSSLSYLSAFPVHTIKIDKSFVSRLPSAADSTIIRSIVDLAHNFGLRAVAEGVENRSQLTFLEQQGCDEAQGFLFSPAVPASRFLQCWRHAS